MMGFAAGFNAGFSSVMQALREREEQKQRDELAAIANENPEQVDGFTPQQGAAINKAASNAEITNYNPEQKTYTVVPKMPEGEFGPAAPQTFAQQGVTDFLGKRTAGDMSPEQADRARMVAMTGVISKTDPVRALSMRQSMAQEDRQAKLDERQSKIFDRQETQWGREDVKYKREEDDFQLMKGINTDVADFSKKLFMLPDGSARQPTATDNLAINQYRTAKLFGAGKVAEASALAKDNMAMAKDAIGLQTEERKAAIPAVVAAIKTGNFEPVKTFYEKYLPDGAKITNISAGKDGKITVDRVSIDGVKLPPHVLGSADELTNGILQIASPEMAFNVSQSMFARDLQLRADKRAQDSANQSKTEKNEAKQEKKQQADDAVALYLENNPGATPAQLNAVRSGVLAPTLDTKNAPSEVKLAKALVDAGLATDMNSGLEMALNRKTQNPSEIYNDFVAAAMKNPVNSGNPQGAVEGANKIMSAMGYVKNNGRWSRSNDQSSKGPKALQNVTDADIKATAKKYNITEDEVRKQLGLTK